MRLTICALAVLGWTACENSDGYRSPCAEGGQILGCDEDVQTAEEACWKLVQCGVFPIEHVEVDRDQDFGGCVDRLYRTDEDAAQIAIECIDASSCDSLIVNDSPANPYEWPDCLEFR